jgi:hypothetical protein
VTSRQKFFLPAYPSAGFAPAGRQLFYGFKQFQGSLPLLAGQHH